MVYCEQVRDSKHRLSKDLDTVAAGIQIGR